MKFSDFLHEGQTSAHGKVEMALRELGLEYEVDESNEAKYFLLNNNYFVESRNNGHVSLRLKNIKGAIDSFKTLDFNEIRKLTSEMVKPHLKEINATKSTKQETKQTETT